MMLFPLVVCVGAVGGGCVGPLRTEAPADDATDEIKSEFESALRSFANITHQQLQKRIAEKASETRGAAGRAARAVLHDQAAPSKKARTEAMEG